MAVEMLHAIRWLFLTEKLRWHRLFATSLWGKCSILASAAPGRRRLLLSQCLWLRGCHVEVAFRRPQVARRSLGDFVLRRAGMAWRIRIREGNHQFFENHARVNHPELQRVISR